MTRLETARNKAWWQIARPHLPKGWATRLAAEKPKYDKLYFGIRFLRFSSQHTAPTEDEIRDILEVFTHLNNVSPYESNS